MSVLGATRLGMTEDKVRRVAPTPRLGARAFALLFLLALAARLAAIGAIGFSTVGFGDSHAYLNAARALVSTGHYPARTEDLYFRAPGYPFFLALVTLGHPERIALAKAGNALLGSLAVPILALLSIQIFRRRRVALWTGALAAVHPSFLLQSSDIQSEALFLFLLVSAGFLLLAAVDRPSSNLALISGLALGLAALTRPTAFLVTPLLAAPLRDRRYPPRARAHLAGSALLGFFFAVAPWTLRNAVVFGQFIPVSDSFGGAFYDGNSIWMERFYDVKSQADYEAWTAAMARDRARRLSSVEPSRLASPQGRSRVLMNFAIEDLRRDPSGALRLYMRKAAQWLRPYPTAWFWPMPVVFAVGVEYTLLYVAGAFGLWKSERSGASLFCLGVLALSSLHILVVPTWRYRVPYWDPVLLLHGVFGAERLLARIGAARPAGTALDWQ